MGVAVTSAAARLMAWIAPVWRTAGLMVTRSDGFGDGGGKGFTNPAEM
jgi:hypothetical protein